MINFIQNNPMLILGIGLILVIVLTLLLIKASGIKNSKKSNTVEKTENLKDENEKISQSQSIEKKETVEKKETISEDEKKSKKKPKKEVEQVFKSDKKEETVQKPEDSERFVKQEKELLEKMAFVNTTKKISKLAKKEDIEKVPESEFTEQEIADLNEMIKEQELKNQAKKTRRFDRSIRLSNFSKSGDYDSMFLSHISDEKTQVDTKRYLNVDDEFLRRLYSRTYETLRHSGINPESDEEEIDLLIDDDDEAFEEASEEKKEKELAYLNVGSSDKYTDPYYDSKIDKGIVLNSENMLVVDSVMHRKDNYKRKNNNQKK